MSPVSPLQAEPVPDETDALDAPIQSSAPQTPAPVPPDGPGRLRVAAARRVGRGHAARGEPCQDAFAIHEDAAGRVAVAVADGLGSRPLSHLGSQAACDAAVAFLAAEAGPWDEAALRRAFEAARMAVATAAQDAGAGVAMADLATTLQVAVLHADGRAWGAMVGDGALVAVVDGAALILLEPAESEYANVVVPLSADDWADSFRTAEVGGASTVLAFTDGLTRLLLQRAGKQWAPFSPFFDSFLPTLGRDVGGAVARLLASDDVDRAWDDDKALVVVHRA